MSNNGVSKCSGLHMLSLTCHVMHCVIDGFPMLYDNAWLALLPPGLTFIMSLDFCNSRWCLILLYFLNKC